MSVVELKQLLKNLTSGKKVISSILSQYEIGERFSNSVINQLLLHHPEKDTAHITHCVMRLSDYRTPMLCYCSNDSETTISWVTCIENLFGKYDKSKKHSSNVIQAMRSAVSDQVISYRNSQTINGIGTCKNCNRVCGYKQSLELHVDHDTKPFKHILEQFCEANNVDINTVELMYSDLKDLSLKRSWAEYHSNIASYQILCKPCNLSKGCKV
jgi:hypothetical protein